MSSITKLFFLLGGCGALLAVLLGAFGAHVLKESLTSEQMAIYHTAAQYHFYHALGLLVIALLMLHFPTSLFLHWSGWLMLVGIALFSGSLYLLSISGISWLGAITPFGGTAFLVAWLLFVIAVLRAA
jgi:uncharacterized membrane protein YgdD (TMEM256/DUF423 family)